MQQKIFRLYWDLKEANISYEKCETEFKQQYRAWKMTHQINTEILPMEADVMIDTTDFYTKWMKPLV